MVYRLVTNYHNYLLVESTAVVMRQRETQYIQEWIANGGKIMKARFHYTPLSVLDWRSIKKASKAKLLSRGNF